MTNQEYRRRAKLRADLGINSSSSIKLGGNANTSRLLNHSARKKKKGTRFASSPLNLVRLAGIEPTTPWFVAKYSIQLSYSREKQNYSIAIFRLSPTFV